MAATIDNIVAALNALLLELRKITTPSKPIKIVGPWTVTLAGTTEKPLLSNDYMILQGKVINLEIKLRDPSTASYTALRLPGGSRWQFHTAGEYYKFDIPSGYYLDMADVRQMKVFSDAGTPVLEVIAYLGA